MNDPSAANDSPEAYRAAERAVADGDPGRGGILHRGHSRSLRSKLVLTLALMLTVVVSLDEIVRQAVIVPEFARLERIAAVKDTNRVLSAINAELEFLAETAADNAMELDAAQWTDDPTYPHRQATQSAPATRPRSLPIDSLTTGRMEWSAVSGPTIGWHWLKPPSDSPDRDFPALRSHNLQVRDGPESGITLSADGDLYLFAAVTLPATSAATEQAAEADAPRYVVGRRFDQTFIAELEKRTCVPFAVAPVDPRAEAAEQVRIDTASESLLQVFSPLLGADGNLVAELRVQLPRDVTMRSNRATAIARYLSLCGACVSLLLLLLLLQRLVIGRLKAIREQTERIAESGILSNESTTPVLRVAGHDEIGQLARSFDRMRVRLSDAQRKLSDTSHAAGMSLVADTVIHNVGNVLTNVNSLIETASARIGRLRIEPLDKLAHRLREDELDEAMWQATPDYLQRLSETLRDDKHELSGLLETLADNVQHIHQVIRDQKRYTGQPVKSDSVGVANVVSEAVRCCRARLDQDRVRVRFDESTEATVWTDRSLLLQILINIINNAGNATRGATDRRPQLDITVTEQDGRVRIACRDNGCGMDSATLSQVFDAQFTTRSSGSGLGLHFCAIAVKRIGGRIRAESDGPGCGATFTVELPAVSSQPVSGDPATHAATP